MGSASPASSDSQATLKCCVLRAECCVGSGSASSALETENSEPGQAIQLATSVVLPKPAGAEIRVSLRWTPAFSRAIKAARSTAFGRGGGINSFVASTGVGIPLLYSTRLFHGTWIGVPAAAILTMSGEARRTSRPDSRWRGQVLPGARRGAGALLVVGRRSSAGHAHAPTIVGERLFSRSCAVLTRAHAPLLYNQIAPLKNVNRVFRPSCSQVRSTPGTRLRAVRCYTRG